MPQTRIYLGMPLSNYTNFLIEALHGIGPCQKSRKANVVFSIIVAKFGSCIRKSYSILRFKFLTFVFAFFLNIQFASKKLKLRNYNLLRIISALLLGRGGIIAFLDFQPIFIADFSPGHCSIKIVHPGIMFSLFFF